MNARSWRKHVAVAALGTVIGIGVGVVVARATPGGATKHTLSFAGRVSGGSLTGKALKFELKNESSGAICVPAVDIPSGFDGDGNFVAELDMSSATCSKLFDGGNVTYTIQVGSEPKSDPTPVNPVPYAKYADVAASAHAASSATAGLETRIATLEASVSALNAYPPRAESEYGESCPTATFGCPASMADYKSVMGFSKVIDFPKPGVYRISLHAKQIHNNEASFSGTRWRIQSVSPASLPQRLDTLVYPQADGSWVGCFSPAAGSDLSHSCPLIFRAMGGEKIRITPEYMVRFSHGVDHAKPNHFFSFGYVAERVAGP